MKLQELKNIIKESITEALLNEAQVKIDNFDLIKNKVMEFDSNGDTVYPVQIIRRWKDNPTDFAARDAGRKNGTYHGGAWYLKHWLVRSADELDKLKPEIINWCESNNARAYITVNSRSFSQTNGWIASEKKKYGRHYHPVEEIKAWFSPKTSDNWKNERLKLFLDIDSPNKYIWKTVHEMISDYGINVVTEYETPSGGLHIVLADKNQKNMVEFKKQLDIFDGGKYLGRLATVHPNEDGKLILYSNVKTPGY